MTQAILRDKFAVCRKLTYGNVQRRCSNQAH